MHERDKRKRSARRRKLPAKYRRRRLAAGAVLFALMCGIGAQAGIWFGGGSEAQAVRSARVASVSDRGSSDAANGFARTPVEEGQDPTFDKAGLLASREDDALREAQDDPADEVRQEASAESLNVLVLGVDRRPSVDEDSPSHSDTMMLVRVAPQTGRIELLSVPRDLLVEVAPGVEDRINTAYSLGGIERAKTVMEDLTGVTIDRHAIVDFGGFEDVVNALGGITVKVAQPIRIGIEGHRVYIPSGTQKLNGLEALAYARYRGTPCGDLDRIKRQQHLIAALRGQALGWDTITKLPRIVTVANENVDTDLGIVQTISVGRALVGRGEKGGLRSLQLKGTPETLPNGDSVLLPNEEANERILENFRGDAPKTRQPDRPPPPEDATSGC